MPRGSSGSLLSAALVGALLLGAAAAHGSDEPQVRAAFGGVARVDHWTEFVVTVEYPVAGTVSITARGARVTSRAVGTVQAGRARAVRIPVFVEGSSVELVTNGPDSSKVSHRVPLRLIGPAQRLVGVPSIVDRDVDLGPSVVRIDYASLPDLPDAVDLLDALVLDVRQLAGLSLTQLLAVGDYVAGCGRLVIIGGEIRDAYSLRRIGCDPRLVELGVRADEVGGSVTRLLGHEPPQVPGAEALSRILDEELPRRNRRSVVVFLAAYACALLVAGLTIHDPRLLLAVPIAAGVILPGALFLASPPASAIEWVSAALDSPVGQHRTLVRVDGLGRRESSLEIPKELGLPTLASGESLMIGHDENSDTYRIGLRSSLFATPAFSLQYARPRGPSIAFEAGLSDTAESDALRIEAAGFVNATAGYLVRDDRVYALGPFPSEGGPVAVDSDRLPRRDQPRALVEARSGAHRLTVVLRRRRADASIDGVEWVRWEAISPGGTP